MIMNDVSFVITIPGLCKSRLGAMRWRLQSFLACFLALAGCTKPGPASLRTPTDESGSTHVLRKDAAEHPETSFLQTRTQELENNLLLNDRYYLLFPSQVQDDAELGIWVDLLAISIDSSRRKKLYLVNVVIEHLRGNENPKEEYINLGLALVSGSKAITPRHPVVWDFSTNKDILLGELELERENLEQHPSWPFVSFSDKETPRAREAQE